MHIHPLYTKDKITKATKKDYLQIIFYKEYHLDWLVSKATEDARLKWDLYNVLENKYSPELQIHWN